MIGYLIRATYLTGPHKGKSYLLRKGGHVTEEGATEWDDTTYRSENICSAQCKKLTKGNELNYQFETRDRESAEKQGSKLAGSRIYQLMHYEPYFVANVLQY